MTYEFKRLIEAYQQAKAKGLKTVLATVVDLEGSSYRKPGVRMLILENGSIVGAVSGGCVEKEIIRQARSVLSSDTPKIMTYDGRFRLGCEGVLYVLIEPFAPSDLFIHTLEKTLEFRKSFKISCYYKKEAISGVGLGTQVQFQEISIPLQLNHPVQTDLKVFEQQMPPCFKLLIFGSEHDAVQLASFASNLGWEVSVISAPLDEKTKADFPGITELEIVSAENYQARLIDRQTAIVLMNHSYAKDLLFLKALKDSKPAYLGILGPSNRREKLLAHFVDQNMDVATDFFDSIHGPAGLNLGAITPQEIALSILSEILAVTRQQTPISLREKTRPILD